MTEKKYRIHPLRIVLCLMIIALVAIVASFLVMRFRLNALNRLNDEARQQMDAHREYLNELEADANSPLDQEDLEDYLRDHNYRYPEDAYYQ